MDFEMIAANELDRYASDEDSFLIDLRSPEEYRRWHIRGAVNIPYERLENVRTFPGDMVLVLYCGRGAMSMAAARELASKGYRVKTVVGGIRAYRSEKLQEPFN